MKKVTLFILVCMAFCSVAAIAQNNQLTDREKSEGWALLFDGKTMNGWRKYNSTEMATNWIIEEEAMKVQRGERTGSGQGGDILFETKKYGNFELSIDWKIESEGNSGFFYYVVEDKENARSQIYSAAPEVQILDNWNASDNILTNHLAGSLYDMLPALPQNAKPHDEWNTIVIRVENGKATHIQNGVLVCSYELWTPEWYKLVEGSKFKDWPGFNKGPAKEGYIGLQDHGYNCWFRNIKIRELPNP